MSDKKTYVLDTNVLLSDPTAIFAFEEHAVVLPLVVLEELDRHKGRPDEVGRNARHVNRLLDDMRKPGQSLLQGIVLPSGGSLRVVPFSQAPTFLPREFEGSKADNLIIALMLSLGGEPTLVSKDINVRVKCDALGIKCNDYLRLRVADSQQDFYRGVAVVEVDEPQIDGFFRSGTLGVPDACLGDQLLYPNQIVVLKQVDDGQTAKSAICKFVGLGPDGRLVPVARIDQAYGLKPRNKEQTFSLDLLFDDAIKLVTLVGASGTGKTLLALAAGLEQLKTLGSPATARYDKLIVTRPVQPVGRDIGFLPGTMEEKMEPWIAPVQDNLNFLMDSKRNRPKRKRNSAAPPGAQPQSDDNAYLQLMQDRGLIEIEAITFIRGRSIPNAFIVIDEAQNLSMHELKTIVTRAGDNTKIVLTGDIEQIDNAHVDVYTNGLTFAVERFKQHAIAGHVTLIKGERSPLATLASQIL